MLAYWWSNLRNSVASSATVLNIEARNLRIGARSRGGRGSRGTPHPPPVFLATLGARDHPLWITKSRGAYRSSSRPSIECRLRCSRSGAQSLGLHGDAPFPSTQLVARRKGIQKTPSNARCRSAANTRFSMIAFGSYENRWDAPEGLSGYERQRASNKSTD